MIAIKIYGGTGNQMFQYALALRLAHDRKTQIRLDIHDLSVNPRPYQLDKFCITGKPLSRSEAARLRPGAARLPNRLAWVARLLPTPVRYVKEKQFHFDPSILDLEQPVYLDGYWQTEKYFAPVADLVREQFQLLNPMVGSRRETAALMRNEIAVSVHVRRGDYVANPSAFAYHGVCPPQWYEAAMTRIAEVTGSPTFFVFSDDPAWARANLPQRWPTHFVDPQTDGRDFEDMHLMSMCRHHIIANSSFSWWGAWLNPSEEKRVIAPLKWFAGAAHDTRDLTPPGWERL